MQDHKTDIQNTDLEIQATDLLKANQTCKSLYISDLRIFKIKWQTF